MLPLLIGEAGVGTEIFHGDLLFLCERMMGSEEDMRLHAAERRKEELHLLETPLQHGLVELISVEHADFRAEL